MGTSEKTTKEEIYRETILKNIERKSHYADHVQIIEGTPLFSWLDINPTELCNRKCEFCPRVDPALYPNQNLNISVELCRKIAAELRTYNYTGSVVFSGYGEPLLHPKIVDIAACFGKDIHTEIVTNGDRLTKELIKDLVGVGVDKFVISLYDGPQQIEHFKNMYKEAGVSENYYFLRDRWYSCDEDYGVKLTNRAGVVLKGNQAAVDINRPCYYPHYSMMIDWNGDVLLCVQDWNKKVTMGNVHAQSLFETWTSVNFQRYRESLGTGNRRLLSCEKCNANGMLHGYKHFLKWKDSR